MLLPFGDLDAMNTGLCIGLIFGFLAGFSAAMAVLEGRAILRAGLPAAPVEGDGDKRGSNLTKADITTTTTGDAHAR